MIVLLLTAARDHTHRALRKTGRFDLQILSYQRAFRTGSFRRATYIFSDFDRLNFWELELAARLFRRLREGGCRVLNDPARVRQRFSLLRALHERGINRFDVWRVEDTPRPTRFPVFLRTESAHRGPLSDLLHDPAGVERAIELALSDGVPLRELMLVEYCAQPASDGIFRKEAIYRVGERMVPALGVHDLGWNAKTGVLGLAGEKVYDLEHETILSNRYAAALLPAFETGAIDYGRADFGIVDGRAEVYEINTNPKVKRITTHPFPIRLQSGIRAFEQLVDAFAAIDTPAGGRVRVDDSHLREQRRRDRLMTRARWTP